MSHIISVRYYYLIYIISDYLFAAVKQVNSKDVAHCIKQMYSHNEEDLTPELNAIWSINEYCKFEIFNIELYAAADAYVRYISWCYIDISNCTEVSVAY